MAVLHYLIFLCSIVSLIHGAKILGIFAIPSHSHFLLGFRLMKELADRGHSVTFINSFPQKEPIRNLQDISVEEIETPIKEYMAALPKFGKMGYIAQMEFILSMGKTYTDLVLKNPKVQILLHSGEKYDLVIMEHFFNEALSIFAHRLNCPLVYFAPGPMTIFNNHLFANPAPSSYVPNLLTGYSTRMNFLERLRNAYLNIIFQLFIEIRLIPEHNALLKANVRDAPDLRNILYNASLMFVMSHISIHDPLPLQPNIKNIGGHHVGPLKPLPTAIREFMDNATEGVIVFSMGSNLKSSNLDSKTRRTLLSVFSKINQKVLWKFETDLDEKPSNVMITEWLPQQEVLAHPNTAVFISHCGLLGTIEAVHFGVPILGLPMFWDQFKNVEEAMERDMAIRLNLADLTEESFENALNEILNNSKYRNNAKLRSRIMRDQPMKPLDEAVFWTEYVIRYEGAPHFKSTALDLKWYQLYLLDIGLFVGFFIIAIYLLVSCTIKYIFFNHKKSGTESKKNK